MKLLCWNASHRQIDSISPIVSLNKVQIGIHNCHSPATLQMYPKYNSRQSVAYFILIFLALAFTIFHLSKWLFKSNFCQYHIQIITILMVPVRQNRLEEAINDSMRAATACCVQLNWVADGDCAFCFWSAVIFALQRWCSAVSPSWVMSDNDGSDDTPDNTEDNTDNKLIIAPVIATRASNEPSRSLKLYNHSCTISWCKAAITSFTFKTLCLTGVYSK